MKCENCGESDNTHYDEDFGFWECGECGYTWALAEDDPDNDEEALSPEEMAAWDEVKGEQ